MKKIIYYSKGQEKNTEIPDAEFQYYEQCLGGSFDGISETTFAVLRAQYMLQKSPETVRE